MVEASQICALARDFPRSYEVFVRGRLKLRVGAIVYVAFSADETEMGFAHPKVWREALVASDPDKFFMPGESDLRFQWCCAWLSALSYEEMRDLIFEAWTMVVPKKCVVEYERSAAGQWIELPDEARWWRHRGASRIS